MMRRSKKRFGFGPEKMIDYKALRGDTSDNIPGVPNWRKDGNRFDFKFGIKNIYQKLAKSKEQMAQELNRCNKN